MATEWDQRLREEAFLYLESAKKHSGGLVSRDELMSFTFEGRPIPLVSPARGIWRPKGMREALSILTTFARRPDLRPYDDEIGSDWYARYKWQGKDPNASDNRALRWAMEMRTPLMWFWGVAPGIYRPLFPVWVVDEEPARQQFVVAVDELMAHQWSPHLAERPAHDPVRRYAERIVRDRLHQRVFSDRVLIAYDTQCALCRLRHRELLDAAHIKPDADGGEPIVPNGLAMCAIHHRSFDAQILTVRPDYRIELRPDVLEETDGPTLRHALQGLHGELIVLPKHRAERPSPELLEERYERFLAAV